MRLYSESNSVVADGSEDSIKFSISTNAKAFKVLSDSIYSDKTGSMVRELCCNGLDSHIENGNPERPIELHLPDQFEPWFTVKDYGVGISPDRMRNVFCVVFESTKDNSDDVIGAFGLGGKLWAIYDNSVSITSVYNGIKYQYAAYKDNSGLPTMDLMMQEETEEENGVEIQIPVPTNEHRAVRDAVKNQLRFFKVKPIVTNAQGFVWNDMPAMVYETDNVSVLGKVDYYSEFNKSFIVQGPVGYAIDNNLLLKNIDDAMAAGWSGDFNMDHYRFLRSMLNTATWFKFEIGKIGVTASREGVEYTKFTVTNVMEKIVTIYNEMMDYINESLKDATNSYERVKLYNQMTNFHSVMQNVDIDMGVAQKNAYGNTYTFKVDFDNALSHTDNGKLIRDFTITSYTRNHVGGLKSSRMDNLTLTPGDNENDMVIIFRDTASRPILRLRQFFEDNKDIKTVYVLTSTADLTNFQKYPLEQNIKDAFGGYDPNCIKLSECVEPVANGAVRSRAQYVRPTAYKMPYVTDSLSKWGREYDSLDDAEFGMDDAGNVPTKALYVTVERQRIIDNVNWAVLHSLDNSDMLDLPVYGIRQSDLEKMKDSDIEWMNLCDWIVMKQEEIRKSKKIQRLAYAKELLDLIGNCVNRSFMGITADSPELKKIQKTASISKKIIEQNENITADILRIAAHSLPNGFKLEIHNNANKFREKTPLLQQFHISRWSSIPASDEAHVTSYINWCYAS